MLVLEVELLPAAEAFHTHSQPSSSSAAEYHSPHIAAAAAVPCSYSDPLKRRVQTQVVEGVHTLDYSLDQSYPEEDLQFVPVVLTLALGSQDLEGVWHFQQ